MAQTRLERLRKQLADVRAGISAAIRRGDYLTSFRMGERQKELEVAIAEAEAYTAKPLRAFLSREEVVDSGLSTDIIKLHLASDYMCEISFRIKSVLDRHGLQDVTLAPQVRQICRDTEKLASLLCKKNSPLLTECIVEDETLLRDVDILFNRYLRANNERLKEEIATE
jgi:hypothetical protein